jgi:hypothetical protein
MHNLIGLYSSAAQSGKSSVARYLEHGYGYRVNPFAYTLKTMAASFLVSLGYTADETYAMLTTAKHTHLPALGVDVRHVLQTLGTEWGRDCVHPEVWLKCWEARLVEGERTVVDDVRFLNEAEMVRKRGGVLVRVVRPGFEANTEHRSEGSLDTYEGFDHVIVNDGDLEQLRHTVEEVLGLN